MRNATNNELAAVGISVTQGLALWVALMPRIDAVREGDVDDDRFRLSMRSTELVAGGITVATGVIGSLVLHSPLPLYASVAIVVTLVIAYETTLRLEISIPDGDNNNE